MTRHSGLCFTTALATLSLFIQGCASAGSPVTQTLRVETPGCPGASCELQNDRGSWQLASTPGTVTLTTSDSPLQVNCRIPGGVSSNAGLPASARPLTATGGVAGGVAGGAAAGATFGAAGLAFIPVLGLIVLATGVAAGAAAGQAVESRSRALTYPEVISVQVSCQASSTVPAVAGAPAAPIGLEVRGLSKVQARDAGLGRDGAVLVTGVGDAGRAAAAGLRKGDIILSAAGHDVNDATALEERVTASSPGSLLRLRVWREGQTLELVLELAPMTR
jgi:hypothetical protein